MTLRTFSAWRAVWAKPICDSPKRH